MDSSGVDDSHHDSKAVDSIGSFNPLSTPFLCRDDHTKFCPSTHPTASDCEPCKVTEIAGRPDPKDFNRYLPFFLVDNPGEICTKGGHAAYGHGVCCNGG